MLRLAVLAVSLTAVIRVGVPSTIEANETG